MSQIFGGIRQVGYIVRDIEAAMQKWLQLGVGPWFYREASPVTEFRYRGRPSEFPAMSIALANSGDLQVELIQPRNDVPSLYRDFLQGGVEGVQHVAYWTADRFDEWKAELIGKGWEEGHEGRIGTQGRFVYLVNTELPGTVVEISETIGKAERFAMIREAAASWDGSDPIRSLTPAAHAR